MAAIDINQLLTSIKTATNQVLNQDIATIKGFSDRQLKDIGQQAITVAEGITTGQITEATRDFFLNSLKDMVKNFLATLEGLVVVTIEKLWNAMVGAIWGAINGAISAATGLVLPLPTQA
ncbi:hypothetical protein PVT67_07795 [Gallaecimonas kandeliae]|uniref:hypothetical protein n=1 Tax=Gallaecimonas kandeliae TaxID=3029055 RepID=UPI0026494122|nr:hypothetical protein [Gallaecimonas kandeliae]WKE67127.1 hypothetical protein PVT67_07795 [Gallaecimonas kandeliae]